MSTAPSARTAASDTPSARGATVARRIGIGLVHTAWRTRVLGAWRVPATGPVLLAGNHGHAADGPILVGASPRPAHFLVKRELFTGVLGSALHGLGQVPVDRDRPDRTAVARALAVLRDGGVLGIFPEGTRGEGDFSAVRAGLAYFALRSGAPVVPVAVLGSTGPGSRLVPALPALRGRLDVVFGDPFDAGDGTGRRTRTALDAATTRVQHRLAGHLAEARRLTGRIGS